VVARSRLLARLDEGLRLGDRLTLVSAPAGFGKTTLLSEWLQKAEWQATWLSLDEGDNDIVRFLTYLIGALQRVKPTIGEGALGALGAPQPPPVEAIMTALINEIACLLICPQRVSVLPYTPEIRS
jgi:LuxR family maltose regulon positive regulatory protein